MSNARIGSIGAIVAVVLLVLATGGSVENMPALLSLAAMTFGGALAVALVGK